MVVGMVEGIRVAVAEPTEATALASSNRKLKASGAVGQAPESPNSS